MLGILRSLLRTNKTILGRWERTDHQSNKIKIDWANVDHCGTCTYKPKKPDNIPIIENIPIKQLPKN
jgi:hypothetical protein